MQTGAWVNSPGTEPIVRPGPFKISIIGDSKYAAGPTCAFQEVQNRMAMLYGDSQPTVINHAIPGSTIGNLVPDGQVAAAIADAPDMVVVGAGVNNITGANRAAVASDVASVLSPIRAALPNVLLVWVNVMFGHSEQWGPDPNQAAIDAVNGGISDSCPLYACRIIDVHSAQQVGEMTLNTPAPGVSSGILSVDGTHGNWRGRPLEGRTVASQMFYARPLFLDVDATPSWNFDSDVTPFFWLEADQLAGGPVSSWGGFTAAGLARPTFNATGWLNGLPCVSFDGVQQYMTSSLVTAAGAKTLFLVYRLRGVPVGFGNYCSMLTLVNGTVSSEYIPVYVGGTDPATIWCCDQKSSGADGFFETGTNDISDASGVLFPVCISSTFAGGSSTDTAQYTMQWGGATLGVARGTTFLAQALTAKCALGARVSDGVTPTNFAQFDLALAIGYPGVLSTVQRARALAKARGKWGP
jgi:lysophospholipase L1-like esterase